MAKAPRPSKEKLLHRCFHIPSPPNPLQTCPKPWTGKFGLLSHSFPLSFLTALQVKRSQFLHCNDHGLMFGYAGAGCTNSLCLVTVAELFTIARILKQPQCLSVGRGIKKTHNGTLSRYKKEILPSVTTWMDLEGFMLIEISQLRTTNAVWYPMWNLKMPNLFEPRVE